MNRLPGDSKRVGEFFDPAEVLDGCGFIHVAYMVKRTLRESQDRFTRGLPCLAKLAGMPREPTKMGARILDFMKVNGIRNRAQFAEGVLGISRQRFHGWLYNEMDPALLPAKPILLCAEALTTNAEYLLGISDDPRVETPLTYPEAQLVQAFRDLSETDRERLLSIAADWVGQSKDKATASAPFRSLPPLKTKG
jgi:hypothetical protein